VKKQTILPAKYLTGAVEPPGDKSISHRYAMLAAMAEGTSELRHFAAAADCHSTLDCMKALGAGVEVDKDNVKVTGRGAEGLKGSWRALDAGNSGTTIRLAHGNSGGTSLYIQADRRCLPAKAPDGTRSVSTSPDGRGHSRARR